MLRGSREERVQRSLLADLEVPTRAGKSVPLAQIARISYGVEEGVIWRRNRLPTITVRANVYGSIQAPVVTAQVLSTLTPIRAKLPPGYLLETGGAAEESAKGGESVAAGVPLFILAVLTALMLQLHSFSRTFLVVLTAPLGLIGVTLFLLVFKVPFGFVAMLGTIALSGMIMRNSVILVDQIERGRGGRQEQLGRRSSARPCAASAHRADRAGGYTGDDTADAQHLLWTDGGGHHGWPGGGDGADAVVPARAVCGVVSGERR